MGSSLSNRDVRAAEWFDLIKATFDAAERRLGSLEISRALGPVNLHLRFAGQSLLTPMTAALSHLPPAQSGRPAVTVCLFEGVSGGPLPPVPWSAEAYGARGEIDGFNVSSYRTVYEAADAILRMADLSRDLGVFWIQSADQVPYYERAAPLRTIFHWLMRRHQGQLVHAAAVGRSAGGVLLAGRGGSGKSTTALACIGSSLRFAGDDYVLLAPGEQGTTVFSLYSAAKLHIPQAARFPRLRHCVDDADSLGAEKLVILLGRHFSDALVRAMPVRAILLPKITGREATDFEAAAPGPALAALAPTTVFQLPGDGRLSFNTLARLVRELPSYWLNLGSNLELIPSAIERVLRQ